MDVSKPCNQMQGARRGRDERCKEGRSVRDGGKKAGWSHSLPAFPIQVLSGLTLGREPTKYHTQARALTSTGQDTKRRVER